MMIPITLEPREAAQLRECLIRKDKEAVRALLSQALELTVAELLGEPPPPLSDEEIDAALEELDRMIMESPTARKTPLPEEAFNRESFYEDRY